MKDGLQAKAVSGFAWRAIERYSVQAARFLISIVLARILSPHEFGLIALVMVFVSFGQILIDGGFSDALVQGEHVNDGVCNSVFFWNIAVGLICAISLALSAPSVAQFYQEPQLRYIVPTLSLNFIISSCGLVYTALLVKRLRFKKLALVSIISTLVSGTSGVLMAVNGFGVWSLVGQSLVAQLTQLVTLWTFAIWHPHARFEWAAIKVVAPFGSRVLLATAIDSLYVNLNVIAIGKLFTPTTLGFYSRADTLWNMTMSSFSSIVSNVGFPILSTIQNNRERLVRAAKMAVEMLAFISYPAAIGMVAVAHPLVLALLTKKWEPCVPFLQLLGGVWVLYPMHAINGSLLLAQGQSKLYLRLQIMKKAICVVALPLLFLGIYPFILGQIGIGLAGYYLNCYYSGKLLGYPLSAQLRDSAPYIGCAVLMGIGIHSVRWLQLPLPALQLVVEVGLGMAFYVWLCSAFRLAALNKAWEIARKWRPQRAEIRGVEVPAVS